MLFRSVGMAILWQPKSPDEEGSHLGAVNGIQRAEIVAAARLNADVVEYDSCDSPNRSCERKGTREIRTR